MLTLKRFKAFADSYGADLRRWPQQVCGDAQALLDVSSEARQLLAAARTLDAAITAGARQDAAVWQHRQPAALARLRSGVAARIASAEQQSKAWRPGWAMAAIGRVPAPNLPWVGIAAGCGAAVIAGLLIGGLYASAPAPDGLLSMLDPAPIHLLVD